MRLISILFTYVAAFVLGAIALALGAASNLWVFLPVYGLFLTATGFALYRWYGHTMASERLFATLSHLAALSSIFVLPCITSFGLEQGAYWLLICGFAVYSHLSVVRQDSRA